MTYHDIWDRLPSQEPETASSARRPKGRDSEPMPCDRARALVAAAALRNEETGSEPVPDPERWDHLVY